MQRILSFLCLQTESSRLLLSLLFVLSSGLFTAYVQQLSDARWVATRPPSDPPLQDLFNHLPNLSAEQQVVDVLLNVLLVFTLLCAILFPPTWTAVAVVYRRMFWVTGMLYLYRALTLTVTTLPTTMLDCVPLVTTGESAMRIFSLAVQQMMGTAHTCSDLIYSGHTMIFTMCAIQFRVYSPYRWLSYYAYCHAAVGISLIVLTHMHYSVDVLLGLFITYGFWSVYFGLVRMVMERLKYCCCCCDDDDEATLETSAWEKYDDEYQRVIYTPRMMNSGLVRMVAWLDGIDLRWKRPIMGDVDAVGKPMFGHVTVASTGMAIVV